MQLKEDRLLLSPTDLSAFLACEHLTGLEIQVARGEKSRPIFDDPFADMIRQKGRDHETAFLGRLEAEKPLVIRIPDGDSTLAAKLTAAAIREGRADIIYQAYLGDDKWRGVADFLERQPDGSYEPVDTKLARATKPEHVLQLCFYAEQVERLQARPVERVHVELGSGQRETFRTADYMAYFRHVRARFVAAVDNPSSTYPWPCVRCPACAWRRECHKKLVEDDNPILVAGLTRADAGALAKAGITSLERLGEMATESNPTDLSAPRLGVLRHQAELQLTYRRTLKHRVDLLPQETGRGFHLLPQPSPGDLWLDFEDHPFFEPARGLECLFGYVYRDDTGSIQYEALWAKDRLEEKKAFEELVDRVVKQRRQHPDMHVYHYADHERSALRRLMGEHGTRESEIDDLLRSGVLVDLYRVTTQALRASVDSYSLKRIEALYGFKRDAEVSGGAESAALFEKWLQSAEPALLQAIELYNEEDCRSTAALHAWLLTLRPAEMRWRAPQEPTEPKEQTLVAAAEREEAKQALLARSSGEGDPAWLLAQLLDYHQREARPQWWQWFQNQELDDNELIESVDALGGLVQTGEPVADKQSFVYTFSYPPQDHKIRDRGTDPQTNKQYDVEVDDDSSRLTLRRAKRRADEPLPRALIPAGPVDDPQQRGALLRFARSYMLEDGHYRALIDLLERRTPRVRLDSSVSDAALSLDSSYLLVQGPPGTGKTWQGAKAAIATMRAGRRIGVTSLSHKAIDKLLEEIEREAREQGFTFRGRKKHSTEEQVFSGRFVDSSSRTEDLLDRDLQLIAGTGWLFAREEFDQVVDTLFIDEAGQVSLADALASGTAARNLVLLGDPNQLPQISQGSQPILAKASALKHLLGSANTVPASLGKFLPESWRLRPELCTFTSAAYYEGRLSPAASSALRSLSAGNGLVLRPVQHEGCSQQSWEEAEAVSQAIHALLGSAFTADEGTTRPLVANDILVVAPYNAQVRALKARVPKGVRVGTVDKFQGQEAAIVFVSLASSSGADTPRGIQFAFDRHRVNVATSRAQCRVVLVHSPRLLEAECRTVEQMRLMNSICLFLEFAQSRDLIGE